MRFSQNARAVESLVATLEEREEEMVFITTVNMAGVLDAFYLEKVKPVQIQNYLIWNTDSVSRQERLKLIVQRWKDVLERVPEPVLVVVSSWITPVDEVQAGDMEPALAMAALRMGRAVRTVDDFVSGDGTELLRLLRVEPIAARAP